MRPFLNKTFPFRHMHWYCSATSRFIFNFPFPSSAPLSSLHAISNTPFRKNAAYKKTPVIELQLLAKSLKQLLG